VSGRSRIPPEWEAGQASGAGRIEFDELGNAVWVPFKPVDSKVALSRLLNDDTLALQNDDPKGTVRMVQPNPVGLKKGYDPYESGLLQKKQWKKKKDLRALSAWIQKKKELGSKD